MSRPKKKARKSLFQLSLQDDGSMLVATEHGTVRVAEGDSRMTVELEAAPNKSVMLPEVGLHTRKMFIQVKDEP